MVCVTLSCTLRILLVSMVRPLSSALQDEHYPHFTEQEAEAQSGDLLQEVKRLLNGLCRSSELRVLTHLSLCLASSQSLNFYLPDKELHSQILLALFAVCFLWFIFKLNHNATGC